MLREKSLGVFMNFWKCYRLLFLGTLRLGVFLIRSLSSRGVLIALASFVSLDSFIAFPLFFTPDLFPDLDAKNLWIF